MSRRWLAVIMLVVGGSVSACASGAAQQDGDHGARGLYVGGGGGYAIH